MAMTSCPKCDWKTFELKEIEPNGSRYKMVAVQCAKCGSVAGVTDYLNVPKEVTDLKQGMQELSAKVDRLLYKLNA